MYHNKTVAVVIPAYNEEKQIRMVIETIPDFVDRIIVINDNSTDRTAEIVQTIITGQKRSEVTITPIPASMARTLYNEAEVILTEQQHKEKMHFTPSRIENTDPENARIILINHLQNAGVGAAIATGYKWCKDHSIDCTAVMAGDGQMDPNELESIIKPVIDENIDYVKGNRLIHRSAWLVIPRVRFFGNSILSILTKIASGYWHVSDTQTGYTAISLKGLQALRLYDIYPKYGMPNDILVKLNIAFCTLKEVEIKPIYRIGEKSKMKLLRVIPKISFLLFKSFFKRLWIKYLFRDFHPLFLLYHLSIVLFFCMIPVGYIILDKVISGRSITFQSLIVFIFLFISTFQSVLFAMWMDMQDNERLYKN